MRGIYRTCERLLFLQMHYSNPSLIKGINDASGVLMRVTDMLKPIDAGYLMLGADTGKVRGGLGATLRVI